MDTDSNYFAFSEDSIEKLIKPEMREEYHFFFWNDENEQLNQKKMLKLQIKAKKQLKDNSLPPALSTRSNDRVLRKRWK